MFEVLVRICINVLDLNILHKQINEPFVERQCAKIFFMMCYESLISKNYNTDGYFNRMSVYSNLKQESEIN